MPDSEPDFALSYEEGVTAGGRALYEQNAADLRATRREMVAIGAFFAGSLSIPGGLLAGLGLLDLAKGAPRGSSIVATLAGFGIITLGLLFAWGIVRAARRLSPRRITEFGLSLGWGDQPYLPFSRVYSLDESHGSKFATAYLVLTFEGGYHLSFAEGMVKHSTQLKDYQALRDALFAAAKGPERPRMEWELDAWALTSHMMSLKGPVRAILERIAREKTKAKVDLAHLEENWRQLRKEMRPDLLLGYKGALKALEKSKALGRAREVE